MTHYIILVLHNSGNVKEQVTKLLAPYDENLVYDSIKIKILKLLRREFSRYNPHSKWDYWAIGGRWNDLYGLGNTFTVKDLLTRLLSVPYLPSTIVTPDGKWHSDRKWGWFATYSQNTSDNNWNKQFRQLLEQNNDYLATLVDCHI